MSKKKNIETLAIHSGSKHWSKSKAIAIPLEPATNFEHDEQGHQEGEFIYTRHENPNRLQLEQLLSQLEGGECCAAFSSGIAAVTAVFLTLPKNAHVIIPEDMYHGSRSLLDEYAQRWELTYTIVDTTETEHIASAIQPETALLFLETPSNPLMNITDLEKACILAHKHEITVCVDNTFATPYNTNPIELGADIVMHSTSKYLGGHSDLLGGALISAKNDERFERIRKHQRKLGAVPSPFDCWLLIRSIRSFPHRMRTHNENAQLLATFLDQHPKITTVFYPGLPHHPGYDIAKAQMRGFGGMISFLYAGNAEETLQVIAKSKLIRRATSLGGIESLWEHRRSSEQEGSTTPENLIRFSVGLEHPDDLIEDVRNALS